MGWLHDVAARVRGSTRRRVLEDEMDEELRFHLERQIEDNMRSGMTREQARRAALIGFGGLDQIKEECRDARSARVFEELRQDVRFGLRILRRTPGVTAAVVLSLALGIGANTAVFTVVDALLVRTLPVERPHELFFLKTLWPSSADDQFSYQALTEFREASAGRARLLAATVTQKVQIAVGDSAETVQRRSVSGNYFSVLGVTALAGRTFTSEEDRLPGPAVAVLGYGYWQRRFGGDPSAIGRTFRHKGTVFTIVGVAPPEFFGEVVGEVPEIWTPLTVQPGAPDYLWSGHSVTWLRILGRPERGVAREEVRARLEPVFERMRSERLGRSSNRSDREALLGWRFALADASRGISELREKFSDSLHIVMAIVAFVLMIACVNVANLFLERGAARQREISVRLAMGAGRARLVRQLVTESLLLSLLGGGAGLLAAAWGARVLVALALRGESATQLETGLSLRVLAFTAGVSILTGILFGLAPALRATRLQLAPALKGAAISQESPARSRLRPALVVGQLALSIVLLTGAALLVRSLAKLAGIPLGFDPDRVLVFRIEPASSATPERPPLESFRRLLERAQTLPGVRAASVSFFGLFTASTWGNAITVEGYTPAPDEAVRTFANAVSAAYFEVLGLPVVRGRAFTDRDDEQAPRVAIVNEAFAAKFFPGADPLGRHVGLGRPSKRMMEIVGMVRNAKYGNRKEETHPMLYVPHLQYGGPVSELEVRTAGDPLAVAAALRRGLAAADPNLSVLDVMPLRARVDASISPERLVTNVAAVFSLVALALASIGLYGILSYAVTRRRAEIGIRMALGASPGDVLRGVLRETSLLLAAGAALGLPAAFAGGRLIATQLYGVEPGDPAAMIAAAALLVAVALVAAYFPARRAARLDPLVALRCE